MSLSASETLLVENARLKRRNARKLRALTKIVNNQEAIAILQEYADDLERRAQQIETLVLGTRSRAP